MQFRFKLMNETYAHAIANWHYEGIYAFYDMDQDIEDLEELLDPHNWRGRYRAVVDEHGELVGFFCFEKEDEAVVIGLGLRPDCTGEGLGQAFVEAGLEYAKQKFDPATFRLGVATFNQRAIRVYEKVGFKPDGTYVDEINGSQHEFLRMAREERNSEHHHHDSTCARSPSGSITGAWQAKPVPSDRARPGTGASHT